MALTTAVLLVVLVFVGVPLQLAAHQPAVVHVVGTLHGFLYIVYLLSAFALTRRLGIPKWQMLLVLAAGTVPLCGFVAERKMTHTFDALSAAGAAGGTAERSALSQRAQRAQRARARWLSPRALVLHLEVLVVAPGCALAGWWQATRALAGNQLSWVYSIEWPIFGLLAIFGWWHLVHEDPETYRARRWRARDAPGGGPAAAPDAPAGSLASTDVEEETGRWAALLVAGVVVEFLLGILGLILIPFGRPSGWLPSQGAAVYGVHATVGLLVGLGAVVYLVKVRRMGRIARIAGWTGGICLLVAGLGGLMTEAASVVRVFGIALMFAASVLAAGAYGVPVILRARSASERPAAGDLAGEDGERRCHDAARSVGLPLE